MCPSCLRAWPWKREGNQPSRMRQPALQKCISARCRDGMEAYIHTYMLVQCNISEIQRLRDLWMGWLEWLEWLENGFLDARDRDLIGRDGHGHGNATQPMLATALQPIITATIHISQRVNSTPRPAALQLHSCACLSELSDNLCPEIRKASKADSICVILFSQEHLSITHTHIYIYAPFRIRFSYS